MKQKKNKQNQATAATPETPSKKGKEKAVVKRSFFKFIITGNNRKFLLGGFAIGLLYFIILRVMYPIPLYFPDSFTYIQVARDSKTVSFRPVQYGQIISFFKNYSDSDFALILGQYFTSVIANLFLFFTFIYFFSFRKLNQLLLFIVTICNPLYLFCSNFVLADSLFSSFTVIWFALLIWILYNPRWYYTLFQLVLLFLLFKLRYNAIIFPFFTTLTLLLSKQPAWKKTLSIGLNFLIIGMLVYNVMNDTEDQTGIRTFSAFGGWQMGNNALFVLRENRNVDMTSIDDDDVRNVLVFTQKYWDTCKAPYDTAGVSGFYMWDKTSPLKQYINQYAAQNHYTNYFNAWTALGPVYQKFGQEIILQKPGAYLNRFVKRNAGFYFLPPFEAYGEYDTKLDTLPAVVTNYYQYKTNKSGQNHPWVYSIFIHPWYYLFAVLNVLFIITAITYFFTKRYKQMPILFNKTLLCYSVFYLGNFFFVVLLAPTTFRYHIFIITLTLPILIWLLQQLIKPVQKST